MFVEQPLASPGLLITQLMLYGVEGTGKRHLLELAGAGLNYALTSTTRTIKLNLRETEPICCLFLKL